METATVLVELRHLYAESKKLTDNNIPGGSKGKKGKEAVFERSNPLPNVLPGVNVVMMERLQKRDILERLFIAFGGR